jgi:hypothetical protein
LSRRAVITALSIYIGVPVVIAALLLLATVGESDLRLAVIAGGFVGALAWPLIFPGIGAIIFWAFHRFRAEKAAGPFILWGCLAGAGTLVVLMSAAEEANEGHLALKNIPANLGALVSNDYDTFVRVVRNSCTDNQRKNPTAGITQQQSSVFCDCYANALARELTAYELNAALARSGQMTPELQNKAMRAAPDCRRLAFGR